MKLNIIIIREFIKEMIMLEKQELSIYLKIT